MEIPFITLDMETDKMLSAHVSFQRLTDCHCEISKIIGRRVFTYLPRRVHAEGNDLKSRLIAGSSVRC
jgi:hypothetical protein